MWIYLIGFAIIIATTSILSSEIIKIIEKIKPKYYIVTGCTLLLFVATLWNVALKYTMPLVLFENVNSAKESTQDINNVVPNSKYIIDFDIDASASETDSDVYEIEICERNKYDDIIKSHFIAFSNYVGTKSITVNTTEYTYKFLIRFKTKDAYAQQGLTVKSLKVNDKDVPLKYKFLPRYAVERLQDINLKTLSVSQRGNYVKTACKLILKNGLLGIGADGWKDRQLEAQDYLDNTNECHSYFFEILLEFGAIGFIGLLGIYFEVIRDIIKNRKSIALSEAAIGVAILALLLHSLIDFELSFMYMLVVLFMLLALNRKSVQEFKCLNICAKTLNCTLLIVAMIFSINIVCAKINEVPNPYGVDYVYENKSIEGKESFYQFVNELIDRRKYISHVSDFERILSTENLEQEEYKYLFDIVNNERLLAKNDAYAKLDRIYFYSKLRSYVTQWSDLEKEVYESFLNEVNEMYALLDRPEKCRLSFKQIERLRSRVEEIKIQER